MMSKHKNTSTAVPSQLDDHLGFWLRLVSNQVSARFQSLVYERAGCSVSEWVLLRVLYEQSATGHNELIKTLGMTKGAISKVISRLEVRGLVKRQLAAERNREQLILLTAAGKKLVPQLAALADENDAHFFALLSADESIALSSALKKIAALHHLTAPPLE
ncbi:MAG: MarR family winged helix-turn-helix transcriptional regulator [Marinagarivorans sp.]